MITIQRLVLIFALMCAGLIWADEQVLEYNKNWPNWRGPLQTGEVLHGNPPTEWSETKNIKWKVPIPGNGKSTPVIWGDKIFITTAISLDKPVDPEKLKAMEAKVPAWMKKRRMSRMPKKIQQYRVLCIDRTSGKVIWEKNVKEGLPHQGVHRDGTWASNSCVTDGKHIIAFFGSNGLYCFDMDGNLKWEKDLGDMNIKMSFGEGISPALYKNNLIINWDHEGPSFISVFDKSTGKEIWKKDRNERTSWSTPIVVEVNGKPQIIVAATGASRGYDLKTGDVIWELSGLTFNVIPVPAYGDGMVYFMSGFRGAALQAVKLKNAKGDLKGTDSVVWTHDKKTPYTPSPLLYKGNLYFFEVNSERLTCADAKTGAVSYTGKQLEGVRGVYASPLGAADRVYVIGRNGVSCVLKQGKEFEVISKNTLDDRFDASPAVVGNQLFLRGFKSLYCIAEK
jgi:outer membrane protein assembly factor BamB